MLVIYRKRLKNMNVLNNLRRSLVRQQKKIRKSLFNFKESKSKMLKVKY
jgi:hypothetical protein